ncbi:MAG: T9SS type A sorting domain-containing protein [Prolixibacteraceae bacterium]|nr:T9SS type A sorting domain-containing protein [Prolixibacteraceae bacterium]
MKKKNSTGIDDVKEGRLNVFPNPTSGEINIVNNKFELINIEIYEITGKRVFSRNVDPVKLISFNPGLQKGIYLLKLNMQTAFQDFKIVID